MNREGHIGLTLAVTSLILQVINVKLHESVLLILLSTSLSVLPDIDLRLEVKHRRYTHNIVVAIPISILIGLLTSHLSLSFWIGFVAGLLGFICHIAGDVLTYSSFPPLWPIVKSEVSLKLFKSNDKLVNSLFMFIGILLFLVLIVKLTS
ncbi:MAG: metal-dependent hydrolase [Candidatus Nezhaarchaeales archaeon]